MFASFYFLKYTHPPTRETKVKHISSSSCYKNQRTKRKTTSRSVKRRLKKVCDIFLLLLRAFEETTPFDRSIDRSRVFDHTTRYERVCFSTRFSREDTSLLSAFALSFIRRVFFYLPSFSPPTRSALSVFVPSSRVPQNRRPVPAPSPGRLQILRAAHRRRHQVVKKKKGVPFRSFQEKKENRDTAFFCVWCN